MLIAGEQSAWPKLLFITNRLKIERLVEEGLLEGRPVSSGIEDPRFRNGHVSMHLHGQAMRNSVEPSTESEDGHKIHVIRKEGRRPSIFEEIKRQGGVFFDDGTVESEETGESERDDTLFDDEKQEKCQ